MGECSELDYVRHLRKSADWIVYQGIDVVTFLRTILHAARWITLHRFLIPISLPHYNRKFDDS